MTGAPVIAQEYASTPGGTGREARAKQGGNTDPSVLAPKPGREDVFIWEEWI